MLVNILINFCHFKRGSRGLAGSYFRRVPTAVNWSPWCQALGRRVTAARHRAWKGKLGSSSSQKETLSWSCGGGLLEGERKAPPGSWALLGGEGGPRPAGLSRQILPPRTRHFLVFLPQGQDSGALLLICRWAPHLGFAPCSSPGCDMQPTSHH